MTRPANDTATLRGHHCHIDLTGIEPDKRKAATQALDAHLTVIGLMNEQGSSLSEDGRYAFCVPFSYSLNGLRFQIEAAYRHATDRRLCVLVSAPLCVR